MTAALTVFTASSRVRRRPYPSYRLLRGLDPVHKSPLGIWVLSSHKAVAFALRDTRFGSDETKALNEPLAIDRVGRLFGGGGAAQSGPTVELFRQLMLFRDPPDHTRLRRLVSKAFTPSRAEALVPRVQEIVEDLLEGPARRGRIELMSEFAYPLPARVICELLGVPESDAPFIVDHAPALATGLDPSPMRSEEALRRADRATVALREYLIDLIAMRRRDGGDDLLSALIAAEDDGDRLSIDELVATILLLLIAGHETTANLIGNGLVALLGQPGQMADLVHDEDLDKTAIEELLRVDPPVQMAQRVTLEDVELEGKVIPAGRIVALVIGAANHDPGVFANPTKLDLARSPNPHLAFGGGAHFCIGAPLARVEARIAIPTLVRRFPGMHAVAPKPLRRPSFTIRAFRNLDLEW